MMSNQRTDRLFPTAVAVGHLCVDTICLMDGFTDENTSKHIEEVDQQAGGGASQAMVAFSRLGGNAGYLGVLGNDSNGDYLLDGLKEERVDVSLVHRAQGTSAFSFVCVNRLNASRTLHNFHDRLPALQFKQDEQDYITQARFLHLDGTMYANAVKAAAIARENHVTVSLDGSSMQKDNQLNINLAKMADILIMNEHYPCRLMEDDNRERALLRIARFGARIVISTLGEKGCVAVVDGQIVRFGAYHVEAVDTTGAGDVFHGAFLRALELGFPLEQAIRFSSAVSAIKCLSPGGRRGIPDFDRTMRFINTHELV